MRNGLLAYLATAIVFFGMDFIWLSVSQSLLYRPRLGALLLDKPNLPVAGIFYLIYVLGIVIFAVLPSQTQNDWSRALWAGALLGLVAYGTYDMTNLATLAGWSTVVSVVDLIWGTCATACAATAAYFVLQFFNR
jgi:uncharacterized membrane protein